MKVQADEQRRIFRGREDGGYEPKVLRQTLPGGCCITTDMCQHLIGVSKAVS
jgi:hypothetical protein